MRAAAAGHVGSPATARRLLFTSNKRRATAIELANLLRISTWPLRTPRFLISPFPFHPVRAHTSASITPALALSPCPVRFGDRMLVERSRIASAGLIARPPTNRVAATHADKSRRERAASGTPIATHRQHLAAETAERREPRRSRGRERAARRQNYLHTKSARWPNRKACGWNNVFNSVVPRRTNDRARSKKKEGAMLRPSISYTDSSCGQCNKSRMKIFFTNYTVIFTFSLLCSAVVRRGSRDPRPNTSAHAESITHLHRKCHSRRRFRPGEAESVAIL